MEDNSKRTNGIGHNSKLNEVDYYGQPPITKAVLELARDAKESAAKALELCQEMREQFASAFKGEEPLTEDQQNINYKAENYNKWVQKERLDRAKLRKIIKPRKLNVNEKHERFHKAEEKYQDCWMTMHSADSALRQLLDTKDVLDMVDEDQLQKVQKDRGTSNAN